VSTQQAAAGSRNATRALSLLFLGAFVMGSSELLIVGVLNLVAGDLNVSVSAAGTLVTGYALGLAIGGPLLTALTIKLDRRTVLCAALVLAIAGNLVVALSTSYDLTLVARTLTGAFAGLFDASAFAVGIAVVPPHRAGRALAVVISGVAVSAAVGVPLGTVVGQALGWRGSYTGIVTLLVITLIATAVLVPSVPSTGDGVGGQAKYAFAPRVLAVLVLCALVFGSTFAALTYIVPFLQDVTKVSETLISVFLLAYGVAAAVGSFGGGRFADRNAERTLVVGTVVAAGSLAGLFLFGTNPYLVASLLLALGVCAMGMGPSLQYRVVALAGPGGDLAQSLPASAINLGIAFGSFAGGVALGAFTTSAAILTGLAIAVIAVPIAWATSRLEPPNVGSGLSCTTETKEGSNNHE
jgi:MFS transporter, DHA1 family, inner membrane transport protein